VEEKVALLAGGRWQAPLVLQVQVPNKKLLKTHVIGPLIDILLVFSPTAHHISFHLWFVNMTILWYKTQVHVFFL
jgi:hypothetical protein